MFTRHYATTYAMLFAIMLVSALAALALGGSLGGMTIVVVLVVAAIFPALAIWLGRRAGYPIGEAIQCARCGAEQPVLRKPVNMKQALHGGHHCAKCGADLDARGRERPSSA